MVETDLYRILYGKRLGKKDIDVLVQKILPLPKLVGVLIHVIFEQDRSKDNLNACWVFDHLMRKDLDLLLPYINELIPKLPLITWETTMRPIARILEGLNHAYFIKKTPKYLQAVSYLHQEIMAEVLFDWLIGNHKVATQVFAMTNLFYLGEKFDWIRPELQSTIEKNMPNGSAGFKNRGAKILVKLKNLGY